MRKLYQILYNVGRHEKCYILLTARAVNEILRQQERMCNKLAKVDFEQWNGFKGDRWKEKIDVRNFISMN